MSTDFHGENENIKNSNTNKFFKQSFEKCEKNWFQILENIDSIVITINSFYKQVFFIFILLFIIYMYLIFLTSNYFQFLYYRIMIDYLMMN